MTYIIVTMQLAAITRNSLRGFRAVKNWIKLEFRQTVGHFKGDTRKSKKTSYKWKYRAWHFQSPPSPSSLQLYYTFAVMHRFNGSKTHASGASAKFRHAFARPKLFRKREKMREINDRSRGARHTWQRFTNESKKCFLERIKRPIFRVFIRDSVAAQYISAVKRYINGELSKRHDHRTSKPRK